MSIVRRNASMVRMQITSADPASMLTDLNRANIMAFDVKWCGDLTVEVGIYARQLHGAVKLLSSRGDSWKITKYGGIRRFWGKLRKRKVLCTGLLFYLAMYFLLSPRILFVQVEGMKQIPENRILEAAAEAGVRFWELRKDLRSEIIKNRLLEEIPELQWVGVNTQGSVAVIQVREREETEEKESGNHMVSHIVAIQDGVLDECTVSRGTALCKVGQAVQKGQILVSGYTDCGLHIQASRAQAEIFGLTRRTVSVITINQIHRRDTPVKKETSVRICIGDTSYALQDTPEGVWGPEWERTQERIPLKLFGDLALPVILQIDRYTCYGIQTTSLGQEVIRQVVKSFSQRYLISQSISCRILRQEDWWQEEDGAIEYKGTYLCRELLGAEMMVQEAPP